MKGIWETMQAGRRAKEAGARLPPKAGGRVGIRGPVLTILTMPRCTVGTAGPPEEPPLCTEEAMCRKGKTATKAAGRLGGVNVGVDVGERPPRREAGGRRAAGDGLERRTGCSQEQQPD